MREIARASHQIDFRVERVDDRHLETGCVDARPLDAGCVFKIEAQGGTIKMTPFNTAQDETYTIYPRRP